jgi:uncharacterized protein (TIGR04255 family)
MSWNVAPQPHKVFIRNPLVAVVVELRFFPILKLAEQTQVATFQERVRETFPTFQDVTRQLVNLGPAMPVEIRSERLFNFAKQDESSTLTLSTSSLALESRRHERREHFINDAKVGIEALTDTCGPLVPTRLGLRYVNLVDKERVEKDLGRSTTWPALVSERFLAVPTGLPDLEETLFACEVGSTMPSRGGQTVRYGLVEDSDKKVKFRLDVDRHITGAVEPSQLVELLGAFADDAFAVFVSAMGPDLKAWMPERKSA